MELAPASVSRSLTLPVPVDEVWTSLRDAEGMAGWLGDAVDLREVVPGAAGTVVDGDVVRRLVVAEVDEGRSVGFVWWDEASPEQASIVSIEVAPSDEGTTVIVTERLAGAATASVGNAQICDLAATEAAWDRRLQALVGAASLAPACV